MVRRTASGAVLAVLVVVGILLTVGDLPAKGGGQGLERAMAAQQKHTAGLMAKGGVVGTALGLDDSGDAVVLVFLEHGNVAGIPSSLDGVKVKKQVTGKIYALADPTARFDRPVPIGVSTGHPAITAGTIGCRVTDGTNVFVLSNNHVLADENQAQRGDSVIQPGTYDGGSSPADDIGTLYDFEPISWTGDNDFDAAIALTTADDLGTATPDDGYGAPSSSDQNPKMRMKVMKYGRTTGLTYGTIAGIHATVNVQYDGGVATFVNQFYIRGSGFSAGGDSGSLIVTQSGKDPVGLLFAGSSSTTFACPIRPILDRFGVSVDDSSGGSGSVPVASFTASPTSGTAPLTVDFTDTSTGSPTSWAWDFTTDGVTDSTAQNPSFTYTAAGTYTVTLTATNGSGPDSATATITVNESGGGGSKVGVSSISYSTEGGRNQDKHLVILMTVEDDQGSAVAGAQVGASVSHDGSSYATLSGTTGTDGTVSFRLSNAPSGDYATVITGVTASGLTWDGNSQPSGYTYTKP